MLQTRAHDPRVLLTGARTASLSLPRADCYSMVILAATSMGYGSRAFFVSLLLCLFCFLVQLLSLVFAILELWAGYEAGPICCARLLDHPVNVSLNVRLGQWFALVFSIQFPCERASSASAIFACVLFRLR